MSEAPAKKMIMMVSSDNETFEVEESVAVFSQTIKNMIEDNCADGAIPIPNVTGDILAKVLEYCKKHAVVADKKSDREDELVRKFDEDFVDVDQEILYDLIMAANYLEIKSLLDLICQKVADMIKGKKPDEIRRTFNIKNDFSPEEEAELMRENAWAFE